MNSDGISLEYPAYPAVNTEFRQMLRTWRELLAHCGQKPGRKSVHNLRVATLRLQAALEFSLSRQKPDPHTVQAAKRWRRQGKKLRRVLGPVRQADVSLSKLARVRGWADPAADGHPVLPKECLGALKEIECNVSRAREAAARKLVGEIERRHKQMNRLSRKMETALESSPAAKDKADASSIAAQLSAAGAEFPSLDSESLHDFRKRIKKIRYAADILGPVDTEAAHQAATLKRMTGAVGEWHDWQVLTEEAARADRNDAAMTTAAEFLQAQAARSLEHALTLCGHSMTRLLKREAESHDPRLGAVRAQVAAIDRKPMVSAPAELNRTETAMPERAAS